MPQIEVVPVATAFRYVCDECGKGEMIYCGGLLLTFPPQYPHQCNQCGSSASFERVYPFLGLEAAKHEITPMQPFVCDHFWVEGVSENAEDGEFRCMHCWKKQIEVG